MTNDNQSFDHNSFRVATKMGFLTETSRSSSIWHKLLVLYSYKSGQFDIEATEKIFKNVLYV